jgi:hypothetical protein
VVRDPAGGFVADALGSQIARSFLTLGVLALGGLALPGRAAAATDQRPIVAVFDIEAKGVRLGRDVLERMTDYLGGLFAARGYRVVPRDEIQARLRQQAADTHRACFDSSATTATSRVCRWRRSSARAITRWCA